ncbi:MAG: chromosomal replication initiator DnaA [Rhizobiales bacterium]|nr:chromosomal replication initiator DnaA [Hyphomicrobiales bacterium]
MLRQLDHVAAIRHAPGLLDAEQRGVRIAVGSSLVALVASVHGVGLAELALRTRGRAPIAFARQVAMYLAHVTCGLTLTEVGRLFDRDRTTVAHACRLIELRRDEAPFDQALDVLEAIAMVRLRGAGIHGIPGEDCR